MQDWSLHSDNKGSYFQCNRFIERYRENGMPEEKGSDSHGNRTFGKGKRHKTIHFIHHYVRFQAHGESMKLESKRSKETKERIVSGLKSCKEGSLKWLQGEKVANPYKGKESDEMFSHLRDLNIRDIKDTVISEYYLPIEESVAFLNDAFEELEKCRNFLRWSYPFALFEFDENFQTVGNKPVMSRKSKQSKDRLDEARLAFDLLQAALEAKTEALSDLIARKRLRGTRNEISLATRDAKSKRLELEILVISYYNIEERDDEVPLSSNSSLTASWDSERDEIKADDPKSRDSKSSRDRQDVMQDFDDNPLRVDDVYSRSYHEYPEDNMRKRNSGASRSSRNSSRRSDDEFHVSLTLLDLFMFCDIFFCIYSIQEQ